LLFGDPKVSVDVDQMGESELPGEAVGSTEGLSCESSQVIDMLWLAGSEECGWSRGSPRTLL
jgi:hypothetical protein